MRTCSSAIAALTLFAGIVFAAPNPSDTRMLQQPAVSKTHIAFIYAEDLYVCKLDGSDVRRLTSDQGVESNPAFSPDGQTIAFSAQYDGNLDAFIIPVDGGSPKRLTFHPGPDIVRGFTPDGQVLFGSNRHCYSNRYMQLFSVSVNGGVESKVPLPTAYEASYSAEGSHLAYCPLNDMSNQWKHYRGGTHSRIWIARTSDYEVEQIAQPAGRCNDIDPNYLGDVIYFRSDRNGEFNLFGYHTASKELKQLTAFTDFPVVNGATGGGNVVFEQSGYLHRFFPDTGKSEKLKIGIAAELNETRTRFAKGAKNVRDAHISPNGVRAVFEFRGEIVTVPAEKGDPRNLTETTGVHERAPAWSPDGKSIAYFSDEGGEYQLHVAPSNGGKAKAFKLGGAGFYEDLIWSPDGLKLSYVDNSNSLYWIQLSDGKVTKVTAEPIYGPSQLRSIRGNWSPDSQWLTYCLTNRSAYRTVFAYSLTENKSSPITDGLSDCVDPVFDRSGKYLYFFGSTDAGPANQWFAQSNADMRVNRSLYLAVLQKGQPSPLARESDDEKTDEKPKEEPKKDAPTSKPTIDFDGIDQRILMLPAPPGNLSSLQAGPAGQVYFLQGAAGPALGTVPPSSSLCRFDLTRRKFDVLLPGINGYRVTADGRRAITVAVPDNWSIADLAAPPVPGTNPRRLNLDAVESRIDPYSEWNQMYDEAWRINRDYFYATNYHGANWPAMKKKYAQFLPHLTCASDLYRVLRWMMSELAVGHSYTIPGERAFESKSIPGGLLGADYTIENGRYRFLKVYGGLNWSPEARSPLTVPGVEVKDGEYLLAVRGIDLKPPTNIYSLFENTVGKSIEITVGPNADGSKSRKVMVEPIGSEAALRNRAWVEGNLKYVHEKTGGKVAYVYVPNTAQPGHTYFKRYFFPQVDKQAIIVDERFNGGGQVADYYIDHLRRPFVSWWTTRYGEDFRTPGGAIFGPKVMLIDETAGSGGDLLPWMFRKEKLGPLVGKRTWGGLVGVLGYPVLMDGTRVTAPNLAFWTEEEGYGVENVGVPPDIEVELLPKDVISGKDPQLDKAIQIIMEELKKNPPKNPPRPAFPERAVPKP
jgi:tricorn protease